MALKIRKLFPISTPSCPYDCSPFPDFYFAPPPPPPSDHHALSPFIIVIIGLSIGCFLFFCYYVLKSRLCCGRSSAGTQPPQSDGAQEEFFDENRVDHPIWYITTVGLQQSVINSISVCKFKKGEGLVDGTECSVCLSEFQEDEMLRLLPKCSHAFHIRCVDTWLRSHTNCPLCRAHILTDIVISSAARPPNSASVSRDDGNLGRNEETQIENHEINGRVGENQVIPSGSCENRGENEDHREVVVQMGEITPKEGIESVDSISNETERNENVRSSEVMDSSSVEL